ncbi:MAG: TonB family protein [Candidatus Omnitrophica bacterium]|nr:TonB family protein [Candidatus Omnitrophota bacterium]
MKSRILIILFVISGFVLPCFRTYAGDKPAGELRLYMGEVKVIPVDNPTRIVIGNPNIIDIGEVTKNQMVINPKAVGKTTLVFWDNSGEQSYQVWVFSEDLDDFKQRIDNLLSKLNLPEVYTQVVEEEDKIFLLGRVKTAQERERIQIALGGLMKKTVDLVQVKEEEAIVEIDVQVLELDQDASRTLGFTWPGTLALTDVYSGTTTGVPFSQIFNLSSFTRSQLNFSVDALVQEGKARILSRPRLACQSGKEAELLVGGEKPTFTTQVATAGGQGTSVDYKEFGIKLKIKPTVSEKDRIKLSVNVEVSEVGDAETIGSASAPSAKAYPLTKRTASTELFLNDSQTLGIGGLIKHKTEEDVRKVPVFGNIPIFGMFFRKKSVKVGGGQGQRGDTELFITITPTIVSRGPQAKQEEVKEAKPATEAAAGGKAASEAAPGGGEGDKKAAAPPAPAETKADPITVYSQIVQNRVLKNISYPSLAKEAGFQGTVKLGLRIAYSGKLLDVVVRQPSGYKILDEQAVNAAKGIESFPPFPPAINKDELWIGVTILYKLD